MKQSLKDDNKASFNLTKNSKSQYQIKHIDIQQHYICKLVNNKELEIEWVPSTMILADKMTKALIVDFFKKHQALLGLI